MFGADFRSTGSFEQIRSELSEHEPRLNSDSVTGRIPAGNRNKVKLVSLNEFKHVTESV